MQCFARLVRLLLGKAAIAADKLEHGLSLCILGIHVDMSPKGFSLMPSKSKVRCIVFCARLCRVWGGTGQVVRWMAMIRNALELKRLWPGTAKKLAGKLAWGSAHMFRQFGRAMLRFVRECFVVLCVHMLAR